MVAVGFVDAMLFSASQGLAYDRFVHKKKLGAALGAGIWGPRGEEVNK